MSDDRALDAAAEALIGLSMFDEHVRIPARKAEEAAQQCVAAYLDHLLGDLPEEAMRAAMGQASWRKAIRAFLQELREGLGGRDKGTV